MTLDIETSSNRQRPILRLLLWTLAGLVLLVLPFYVLHRNSYCVGESRFVQESEQIDAAVREEVRYLNARMSARGRKLLPFKDKTEFLGLNPDCCKILRGAEEDEVIESNGLLNLIFGYYGSAVEVKYTLKIQDSEGRLVDRLQAPIIVVDSCGRAGIGENDVKNYSINIEKLKI
jgi:hypothetical protein